MPKTYGIKLNDDDDLRWSKAAKGRQMVKFIRACVEKEIRGRVEGYGEAVKTKDSPAAPPCIHDYESNQGLMICRKCGVKM